MPTPAAAWAAAGRHDHRAGNDDHGPAIWTASAIRTAVEARTAPTGHLDDQIGWSPVRRKWYGQRGTAGKYQNENKSDESLHALLLMFARRDHGLSNVLS